MKFFNSALLLFAGAQAVKINAFDDATNMTGGADMNGVSGTADMNGVSGTANCPNMTGGADMDGVSGTANCPNMTGTGDDSQDSGNDTNSVTIETTNGVDATSVDVALMDSTGVEPIG